MLKKSTWVVGLLAALAMMFIGCVDTPVEEEGAVITVVGKLSDVLKEAPVGVIDDWGTLFKGTPFMKCGDPRFSVIEEGGVKKLQIDKMNATWGQGLDIYNSSTADGAKGANFKEKDTIFIKGKADADKGLFINIKAGAFSKLGNWSPDADAFETTLTLTAADVGDIKAGSPQAARVNFEKGNRQGTIILEELIITGMRKAGDEPPPPPPPAPDYIVPTTYTIPASGANYFYVNLNDYGTKGGLSTDVLPTVSLTTSTAAVNFTANGQRVNFKLSGEQRNLLLDAGGVKVTIVATASDVATTFRYTIGDATAGGGWNSSGTGASSTTMVEGILSAIIGETSAGWNSNLNGAANAGWFILQARNANVPCLVTITSIKIELLPPVPVAAIAITMTAPIGGLKPIDDVKASTVNIGDITWFPALKDGKFALSTVYYAKITVTAKPGTSLPIAPIVPTVNGDNAYYNPETRTITTANFARTDSKAAVLKAGVLFDLSTWIVGKSTLSGPLSCDGGADKYAIESNTIKMVTRTAGWHGVEIMLSDLDVVPVNPAVNKIKIVVTGKIDEAKSGAGADEARVVMQMAGAPYTYYGATPDYGNGSVLKTGNNFTLTIAEIPASIPAGDKARIQMGQYNSADDLSLFTITGITITNEGQR